MSYTRLPFDAANASWAGAAVYERPAHGAAHATFAPADEVRVELSGWVITTPPTPPAVTASGRIDPPIWNARGSIQAPIPVPPPVTVSGGLHEFVPYVDPGLILTLECRAYHPRPLECEVWLDSWQPPCRRVVELSGWVTALAPTSVVTVSGRAHGVQPARGEIAAATPLPVVTAYGSAQQDLALPDNAANGARAAYARRAGRTATRLADRPAQAIQTQRRAQTAHQQARPIQAGSALAQTQMRPLRLAARLDHTHSIRVSGFAGLPHSETARHRESIQLSQTESIRTRSGAAARHAERIRTRTRRLLGERQARATAHLLQTIERQARATQTRLDTSQQQMMRPLPGRWWPWYEPPSLDLALYCNPDYIARPLSCLVVLCGPQPHCPGVDPDPPTTIIIPIRRVYRVQNTVSLVRVRDGHPIAAARLSLSLSADAWTWSWSATLPADQLGLIQTATDPEELLATINGEPIRLRIDQISRSRAFGQASLSVSGRGRAAELAGPAAPTLNRYNTEMRTAQQLLIDALTDNGVPIGWTVDWRLEDWSVPAGAWSHTGTYIEAATRIAEAGGGYVQAHDTDATLILLPYYPVLPWDWAETDPDILMPEDVCRTEGIEWREVTPYDAVWITGGEGGRRDRIRRAGTAGERQAPTIVDALATDVVMTRQRGSRVLADTGRQAWVTVSLPVIAETGLIRPGSLIEYREQGQVHLGLSRSLSVEASFPTVWQTIQLETHP